MVYEALRIADAAQVEVLLVESAASLMAAYVTPRTQSEVAAVTGRPMSLVHRWTRRLADVGLLEVVDVIPRRGRPMKYFRAVASVLDLPADLIPMEYRESIAARQAQRILASRLQQRWFLESDLRVELSEHEGQPHYASWFLDATAGPGLSSAWYFLADEAQAEVVKGILQRAFAEIEKVTGKTDQGPRWMLHLDLSPDPHA